MSAVLTLLRIKNLALVEELEWQIGAGFAVSPLGVASASLGLPGECVGGGKPAAQLVVEVSGCGDADAVGEQRVELGRRLQPAGRWRCWRQDQAEVDAAGGAGLDHRELVAAAKTQVALLRDDVEGAKRLDLGEESIVQRPEPGFRTGVRGIGRVRRLGYTGVVALRESSETRCAAPCASPWSALSIATT